jgi:GT2 family glycosyltransferase
VSISVIVPVWNGRDLLSRLLDTIQQQTLTPGELLIVDNGSEDGAAELAEQRGACVIRLGRNTGFAHAVNRGIEASRSDKLAIVNSDVELAPDWLEKLNDSGAQFATGKILSASNPELIDGTYDLLCRGSCPWRAGHGKPDGPVFSVPAAIQSAPFTAALFDREIFRRVGMLDERFESYLEDVDFGLRCAAQGIRGAYVPDAVCTHQGSAALGRWHSDSVRRMARNQVYMIAKQYPGSMVLRWLWPILLAHLLWGALAVGHSAGLGWLRGKWEGVIGFRAVRRSTQQIPEHTLYEILSRQESAIRRLQHQLGADLYWRIYFALTSASGAE